MSILSKAVENLLQSSSTLTQLMTAVQFFYFCCLLPAVAVAYLAFGAMFDVPGQYSIGIANLVVFAALWLGRKGASE